MAYGILYIVQSIKSVEENIEDNNKNENIGTKQCTCTVFIKKIVSKYASE